MSSFIFSNSSLVISPFAYRLLRMRSGDSPEVLLLPVTKLTRWAIPRTIKIEKMTINSHPNSIPRSTIRQCITITSSPFIVWLECCLPFFLTVPVEDQEQVTPDSISRQLIHRKRSLSISGLVLWKTSLVTGCLNNAYYIIPSSGTRTMPIKSCRKCMTTGATRFCRHT